MTYASQPTIMTYAGFPTPAAYAAYTGRGYSSYPGFGLASGIAGYPAGKSYKRLYFCWTRRTTLGFFYLWWYAQ